MTLDDEGRSTAGREVVRFIPCADFCQRAGPAVPRHEHVRWRCSDELAPKDIAGWRTLIKETDELLVAVMGAQVEQLRSSVQSRSVGGVPVFVVTPEGVDQSAPLGRSTWTSTAVRC